MTARSNRREVRNPALALPSFAAAQALPPDAKAALCAILADLRADTAGRAQKAWKQNKAPMAAYWKAVSVYSLHIRRALQRPA